MQKSGERSKIVAEGGQEAEFGHDKLCILLCFSIYKNWTWGMICHSPPTHILKKEKKIRLGSVPIMPYCQARQSCNVAGDV